jgi:hypothetical protein
MQLGKFQILIANVTLSSIVGHRISFTIASLLHNEMKIVSLCTKNFKQFHMNVSCMVTLSCSKYKMKFKRRYYGVNFHGQLKITQCFTWLTILGMTNIANFLNSVNVKLVKVWNNPNVISTSQTPIVKSTI